VEKLRPESHYSHHTRSKSVKSAAILSNSRPITSNTRNIHTPGILRKSRDFNADLSKQTDSKYNYITYKVFQYSVVIK